MDSMQFEFECRPADDAFRQQQALKRTRADSEGFFKSKYGLGVSLLIVIISFSVVFQKLSILESVLIFLIAVFVLKGVWINKRLKTDNASPIFGRMLCKLDERGIGFESDDLKLWVSWAVVRSVEEFPGYILVYYDAVRAIVVPKTAFKGQEELNNFLTLARQYDAGRKNTPLVYNSASEAVKPSSIYKALFWIVIVLLVLEQQCSTFNSLDKVPEVVLSTEEARVVDDSVIVLGQAHNPGKSDWAVSSMSLLFYDEKGNVIDQCDVYASSLLVKAGQSDHFKASCGVPKNGVGGGVGAIMPNTLKHFSRVEAKAKSGYKTELFLFFR